MNRKRYLTYAVLAGSLLIGGNGNVMASEGLGVSVKAGTLGLGAELSISPVDNLRLRGGFNYLTYSFDSTLSDVSYDFDTEFNSVSVFLDWHPFGGSFFLSGGAVINNNSVTADGSLDQGAIPADLARYAYLADLVSITGDVEFNPVAPYLGLGWRSNNAETGWGIACELGVMFQGAPDVTNLQLNTPIDLSGSSAVQEFLDEQRKEIEDELSKYEYYPVASIMLIYNF